MWRYQSYDEGRTDSGKTSSGRNPAFNLYLYIFIHRCINFFAILVSQVRCYCNLYLLSFIVTMYWTKFLYEQYSNSRVLIHYIEGHYFYCIFCVNNWLSFHTLLLYINSFLYLQIQLYDTFSLSLHHVQWILCYRIKNLAILHGIYKANEAKDLCVV